jgi:hypothetical protein
VTWRGGSCDWSGGKSRKGLWSGRETGGQGLTEKAGGELRSERQRRRRGAEVVGRGATVVGTGVRSCDLGLVRWGWEGMG